MGIGEMDIRLPSSGVSIRESLAKFLDRRIPLFPRNVARTWVVEEKTGGETERKAREGRGGGGGGGGRGVIVLQNNLNFNYFGELQKRRCDSLTVCHRKINWLPSLPIAPLRPRSKLSYDPLSPFLSSPLASSLPPPPPPPSTFPFHPPPPFLRRRRPHHRRRHPLVDQLLGAKRGGDRTVFPGVPSVIPMQLAAELSVTFRAAADHPRIRPDISEYPRVQFNRLVKFDRDLTTNKTDGNAKHRAPPLPLPYTHELSLGWKNLYRVSRKNTIHFEQMIRSSSSSSFATIFEVFLRVFSIFRKIGFSSQRTKDVENTFSQGS